MALTESDIAQVLEAVKAESKSVESLETVGSLSGVKSLPGQKGDKLVNVPITLLSKPADDAAARAIAAAERVEELAPEMEAATRETKKAIQTAGESAAKAASALSSPTRAVQSSSHVCLYSSARITGHSS